MSRPDDSKVIEARSPRLVGYARVSTDEHTTALRLDALRAAGCAVIHEDAASGALRSRPGLDRAIADLAPGDTLVVWRLDRLGRSLRALLDVAEMLRERGVSLRSLTEQIDTGTAAGKTLYAVLGAVAQFERAVIPRAHGRGALSRQRIAANGLDDGRRSHPCHGAKRRSCLTAARVSLTLRAPCALGVRRFIARSQRNEQLRLGPLAQGMSACPTRTARAGSFPRFRSCRCRIRRHEHAAGLAQRGLRTSRRLLA